MDRNEFKKRLNEAIDSDERISYVRGDDQDDLVARVVKVKHPNGRTFVTIEANLELDKDPQ